MAKKVLVVSTSPRKGGNSDLLADAFVKGAQSAGNSAEKVSLIGAKLEFCRGCLACQHTGKCVIHDDASRIMEKIAGADVVAFATPVYFYEMCGQMKTLLDRSNPIFGSDYKFRDVYLLASSADADSSAMDGAVSGLNSWIACFDKSSLKGVVRGTGATAAGEISKKFIDEAFSLGKKA